MQAVRDSSLVGTTLGVRRFDRRHDSGGEDNAGLGDREALARSCRLSRLHGHGGRCARAGYAADTRTVGGGSATAFEPGGRTTGDAVSTAGGTPADRGSAPTARGTHRALPRPLARADPDGRDLSARSGRSRAVGQRPGQPGAEGRCARQRAAGAELGPPASKRWCRSHRSCRT